uniref:Connector enhancer of kinase suppressor of Ras 1 n=1 Tax=Crocodylus porosus TaxID=8502 RepID=A0A7M4E8Q6_CROPO
MEPVGAWSPARVARWLRGLDERLQRYPWEAWTLTGQDLLCLSHRSLESLGVRCMGHQELLLEAVEQLCALVSARRELEPGPFPDSQRVTAYAGDAAEPPALDLLASVVELVGAAKGLFSWLNRYQPAAPAAGGGLGQARGVCALRAAGGQAVGVPCRHVVGICESILSCSPTSLLDRTAVLESVVLDPGIEIKSTSSGLHFISGTGSEVSARAQRRGGGGRVGPGWLVPPPRERGRNARLESVGWTRRNLAKKLLEKPSQVTLVLKRIPLSFLGSPPSQVSGARSPHIHSRRAQASATGSRQQQLARPSAAQPGAVTLRPGSPSLHAPLSLPCAGVATRLSRRRVSCRDLGRVDCDGWLLKKKDHAGFMAQKWKRCWFVLKGHSLYWYNHPQDEKAAGLINVATYNLESTRELKKKYVFQLSHEKYKPFVFAAETLSDLSMLADPSLSPSPDCYSETEAEDPDDDSPRPSSEPVSVGSRTVSLAGGRSWGAPRASPPAPSADAANEDLESLIECLKQGGVSLIGRQQFLTHEQYRRSFIKRNANPHINEKVHLVRALQSTLKAKEAELQVLDQLLGDTELTLEKFQTWKKEHQEVYQEIQAWGAHRLGQDEGTAVQLSDEPSPQGAAAALTP